MTRWDTPNFNPPNDRKGLRNTVLALLLLLVAIGAVIGAYSYLNQTTTTPPPPVNSKICDTASVGKCFTSQTNATMFGAISSKWMNNATISSYNNTVFPYQVWFNATRGIIGIQVGVAGVSSLNITLIRIYDLNMSSTCSSTLNNCSTYTCLSAYMACSLVRAMLFFTTSIPLRTTDSYELVFGTSGVTSTWKFQTQ